MAFKAKAQQYIQDVEQSEVKPGKHSSKIRI